ncbi:RPM1-interacting protein 4-like isoform X2 [Argentina anserina]|uniref:RPM1-interacting protein 4-like isoform X2 n=1 Tax=Argentina anserina TaxID=57926 RepID=UPI00217628E1|nr:RPM1-interacting protein 4-like isoform X2 [Potentilla anserina]
MAKRPHVPKFGDWNNNKGGNVPYTAVFDKARKGKLKDGVKILNPNDPEENPEAFNVVEKDKVVKIKLPIVAEENRDCSSESETIARRPSNSARLGHHRRKSDESELSMCTEKLSFECNNSSLILQQRRQQRLLDRSEKKKSMEGLSKRFGSSRHHRKQSSITDIDMIPIPKFGDWDESDPKSGEDYTYKFNKVKEENKNISEMFSAALSSEPNGHNANNHETSFSISKICCFHIFPRGRA